MYKSIIRPFLFQFDPEKVHHFTTFVLKLLPLKGFVYQFLWKVKDEEVLEKEVMGIPFKNPIGLAAGFDKNAEYFDSLSKLGFGFIEVGTVTPKAQEGNPKKRLFRLKQDGGIINRMGFNNKGVDTVLENVENKGSLTIGGNIGKNKVTPNENAIDDYLYCFEKLHEKVDYFAVNVSSPNTPNLRELQGKESLKELLGSLQKVNESKSTVKPILLKIAPDLNETQLLEIIEVVKETGIEGVISTNTTISREGLVSENKKESGGLSGKPLTQRSTEVIRFLRDHLDERHTIIGVGGIFSTQDAMDKMEAGADLIQLYTGFIYEGPKLMKEIKAELVKRAKK